MQTALLAFTFFFFATILPAQSPERLWNDLSAMRNRLPSFHQEFSRTTWFGKEPNRWSSEEQVSVDMSNKRWREAVGSRVEIFKNGKLCLFEEGGHEYVCPKPDSAVNGDPQPEPYWLGEPDWTKTVIAGRQSCGLSNSNHECIVFGFQFKRWRGLTGGRPEIVPHSSAWTVVDSQTGLIVGIRGAREIETTNRTYNAPEAIAKRDFVYKLKRLSYGALPDENLFQLPPGLKEVKEFAE